MPCETICLLGGYGDVGLRLARLLRARSDAQIILAGRDGEFAAKAAREVGPGCKGMALDIRSVDAAEQLRKTTLCVNLTEATPPALAAALVGSGIHFIDSSASPNYVVDLRKAISLVAAPAGTAILETGLAPGLTNLIAARLCYDQPEIRRIDVLVELGMGVHHGFAATEWTLQSLGQTYSVKINRQWQEIRVGTLRRMFDTKDRRIDSIGFAFSDQQSIALEHELDDARTFFAIHPGWVTSVVRLLSHPSASAFVRRHAGILARWILRLPVMGETGTRLVFEAFDCNGSLLAKEQLCGGSQAELTAVVLAETVLTLLQSKNQPGLVALGSVIDVCKIMANKNVINRDN